MDLVAQFREKVEEETFDFVMSILEDELIQRHEEKKKKKSFDNLFAVSKMGTKEGAATWIQEAETYHNQDENTFQAIVIRHPWFWNPIKAENGST